MKRFFSTIVLVFFLSPANAVYNANVSGVVAHVAAYADGDYIYFTLVSQLTSHPGCSPTYFVIDADVPVQRRMLLYVGLMNAFKSGDPINIGYDGIGDCSNGYIRVHRVG